MWWWVKDTSFSSLGVQNGLFKLFNHKRVRWMNGWMDGYGWTNQWTMYEWTDWQRGWMFWSYIHSFILSVLVIFRCLYSMSLLSTGSWRIQGQIISQNKGARCTPACPRWDQTPGSLQHTRRVARWKMLNISLRRGCFSPLCLVARRVNTSKPVHAGKYAQV